MAFDGAIVDFSFQEKFGETLHLKELPTVQTHLTDFYELQTANEAIAQLDEVMDPDGEIITFEDIGNDGDNDDDDDEEEEEEEDEEEDNDEEVEADEDEEEDDENGNQKRQPRGTIKIDKDERDPENQKSEPSTLRMGTIHSTKEDSFSK
ncbi:hypothetical protein RFI_33202, partial [Reticulomyxa filosa]